MADALTLLIRDADCVVTMDDQRRELVRASIRVRGAAIEAIGPAATVGTEADEVIDARGHVVTPGLVNTHHHMFQSLTRAIPAAQDAELFGWLRTLYPLFARLTPEMVHVSTQVAMAELLLAGCTTSSDHLYVFPNGVRLTDSIEAATAIGMRFHAARGSMSVGESAGGLPPDSLVEDERTILADTRSLIEQHDDRGRYAMLRVVAAPCSPFSVSRDLMRETAVLARSLGARLHTHLAENDHDVAYSRQHFGMTPAQYAESLGWLGDDVWHAHCVKLDAAGITRFLGGPFDPREDDGLIASGLDRHPEISLLAPRHVIAPVLDDTQRAIFDEDACHFSGGLAIGLLFRGRYGNEVSVDVAHERPLLFAGCD